MNSAPLTESLQVIKEGHCERQRNIIKIWEQCYLKVTNKDIIVFDNQGSLPRCSYSYCDIISIKQNPYNNVRRFSICLQMKKKIIWFSFSSSAEVNEWFQCMYNACIDCHQSYTKQVICPGALDISSSRSSDSTAERVDLDVELGIILRRLLACNTQDDLKTNLVDIQRYQNEKPIEVVGTQKAFVQDYFDIIMESKHHLLSENMTTFMRQLLEDFDNPCLEVDNQASSQFQPRDVDINTVVQLGETIGRGRYGLVRKGVLLSTGEIVAVKIIQKNELQSRDVECILRECRVMYALRKHPHIISLKDFCQNEEYFYIIEELAEGGELFDAIINHSLYSERNVQQVVRTLLYTLYYCHERNIVHRDLKPENILLKQKDDFEHIKIADFGFATFTEGGYSLRTICGTPGYSAPEVIRGEHYGPAVDMWSLGVITYILLCGYPPFPQTNDSIAMRMIVSGTYEFHEKEWKDISDEAKEFIRALLVPNPQRRATARMASHMKWMRFESQRTMHMNAAIQELTKFNARRKDQQYPCVSVRDDINHVVEEVKEQIFFISLTDCGIRDNPSLARSMIAVIPARNQVPIREVIYTNEGVWVLLNDSSNRNWLLVEKHGYDPMCIPSNALLYRSNTPRGQAMHNIRDQPSINGRIVGKIPSGVLFVGVREERNAEGVWVVLSRQTLHSYDIPSFSSCYLCAMLYPSNCFVDRIK